MVADKPKNIVNIIRERMYSNPLYLLRNYQLILMILLILKSPLYIDIVRGDNLMITRIDDVKYSAVVCFYSKKNKIIMMMIIITLLIIITI